MQKHNQHRYDKHLPVRRNMEVTVNSAKCATYIDELTDSRCRVTVGLSSVDTVDRQSVDSLLLVAKVHLICYKNRHLSKLEIHVQCNIFVRKNIFA